MPPAFFAFACPDDRANMAQLSNGCKRMQRVPGSTLARQSIPVKNKFPDLRLGNCVADDRYVKLCNPSLRQAKRRVAEG
jgi:hypothetical protein